METMAIKPSKTELKQVSETPFNFPDRETLRQAWNIFVFSSIFAVLFNAFYSDGIELKFTPPKPFHIMDRLKQDPPAVETSPGWKTPGPKVVHPRPAPTLAADQIPRVSLMGVENRFDKKSCVFLDARKPEEYKEGHIPGALNLFANDLDKNLPLVIPQLPDRGREIIAYCHGGDCDLSLLAAKALRDAGYTKVGIFDGGWPDWKKSGYPIAKGETP